MELRIDKQSLFKDSVSITNTQNHISQIESCFISTICDILCQLSSMNKGDSKFWLLLLP